MAVITFVNPKGGTGKTTSCLLLAEQMAAMGYKLTVLDCDPNRNLVAWREQREQSEKPTPFMVLEGPSEDDLLETVERLEEENDAVLMDMEGTAAQIVTFALAKTDLCIIPFEPTPMETRQAAKAVALVKRTGKMISRDVSYSLVMTRTNAAFQTSDEKDVRAALGEAQVLDIALVRRAAYTRVFRQGDMLSELDPTKVSNVDKAQDNARAFAQSVIKKLSGEGN